MAALRAVRRAAGQAKSAGPGRATLLYASRTHSQLAQVVAQLQHVWMGGLRAIVVGSREQGRVLRKTIAGWAKGLD